MTKQQLKDYEKVQPTELLELWIECEPEYANYTLETLPLHCAISDIDSLLDNTLAELREVWGDTEYRKYLLAKARKAIAFLKKYQK